MKKGKHIFSVITYYSYGNQPYFGRYFFANISPTTLAKNLYSIELAQDTSVGLTLNVYAERAYVLDVCF